ncbi:MAG: hypothetical protein WCO84_09090, partial [bacterium]
MNKEQVDFLEKYVMGQKWNGNDDGEIDTQGDVRIEDYTGEFLPVQFGTVKGCFRAENCKKLKSLKGSPKTVYGTFSCRGCTSLVDLNGCTHDVGEHFECDYCTSLKSLKGAPKKVYGGDFSCGRCKSLVDLSGAPEYVEGSFRCNSCENLASIEGAPLVVGVRVQGGDGQNKLSEGERKIMNVIELYDMWKK